MYNVISMYYVLYSPEPAALRPPRPLARLGVRAPARVTLSLRRYGLQGVIYRIGEGYIVQEGVTYDSIGGSYIIV
jgi:hypothetical protein